MALRYGSKIASSLRYNQFNSSVLRYGSKIGWTSGGEVEDNTDIATPAEYFTFTSLSDGTYSLKAKDVTNIPENVILPSVYNGKAVTKIEDFAFLDLTSSTFCTAITSVIIPEGYTTIGKGAFYKCSNLASITVPDSVVSIGGWAFHDTAYYADENNWTDNVFYLGNHLMGAKTTIEGDYIIKEGTISICQFAFRDCSSLTSVVIPDSVVYIGEEAFGGCSSLTSVNVPDNVTTIDYMTFSDCSSLTSITIPDSVTSIGSDAFRNCYSLESVTIPNSVTSIGDYAFYGCKFDCICIPDSVTYIGNNAFTGTEAQIVFISDSVVHIGYNAFYTWADTQIFCEAASQPSGWHTDWNEAGIYTITTIWGYKIEELFTFTEQTDGTYSVKATDVSTLPSVVGIPFSYNGKAVTAIDENAFYSATINKVVIPEGVTRIGNGAFDNCKRLLNVSLPSTLTEIGGWAFRDCTALTSIVIPIGVTTIGTWAFLRDMSLTINCEASSQPSGWHTDWNLSGGTVVWGYTG